MTRPVNMNNKWIVLVSNMNNTKLTWLTCLSNIIRIKYYILSGNDLIFVKKKKILLLIFTIIFINLIFCLEKKV